MVVRLSSQPRLHRDKSGMTRLLYERDDEEGSLGSVHLVDQLMGLMMILYLHKQRKVYIA